ncbi:hypothetical protein [Streptomyces alfalfae]|uniref:hypothetical protein n=1 Tax=Streptomyces alfalfae TaxID=1642299 RepID=UPI001F0B0076|nr:hypothetical protein [Streptomyces alfalfae]
MLEEDGRRYWAPRRYGSLYAKAVTALDSRQAAPVVVTTLEQLQEHGADAEVWRRLGRTGEQKLTAALDNPLPGMRRIPHRRLLRRPRHALRAAPGDREVLGLRSPQPAARPRPGVGRRRARPRTEALPDTRLSRAIEI